MAPLTFFTNIVSSHAWNVVLVIAFIISLTILTNVLQQTLLKKSNEPPVVFHWLPVVGSTVTYGIDPFKFFFQCQVKVRIDMIQTPNARILTRNAEVWRYFHLYSTRKESYRLPWAQGQPIHLERKAQRCQCRRDLFCLDDACFW